MPVSQFDREGDSGQFSTKEPIFSPVSLGVGALEKLGGQGRESSGDSGPCQLKSAKILFLLFVLSE